MAKVPHLKVPFAVDGEQVAVVEQNSIEEVKQCVLACLSTPLGSRQDPEYGILAGLFGRQSQRISTAAMITAVEEAEPRARLLSRVELEGLVRRVLIGVEAAAT